MNMMVSRRALMGGMALGGAAALLPRAALAWKADGAALYPATNAFIKGFVDRRELAGDAEPRDPNAPAPRLGIRGRGPGTGGNGPPKRGANRPGGPKPPRGGKPSGGLKGVRKGKRR